MGETRLVIQPLWCAQNGKRVTEMHQAAVSKYLEQLREIKERGNVFLRFARGTTNAVYEEATVEVATLQLRRILELLSFGFVCATGEKAIPAYSNFVKYKNVADFFSRLNELNGNYYPQPIRQLEDEHGTMQWIDLPAEEYLTPQDFAILFEHCDRVIEPRCVGALPMSLEQCKSANLRWFTKIVQLLNAHLVHPDSSEIVYLFQMGAPDTEPTCSYFKIYDSPLVAQKNITEKRGDVTLKDHLRRQLEYIRRSCELYDAGHLDESIRLAVTIRVLLHDTKQSQSLLRQMNIKDKVKLATSFGYSETLPEGFVCTSIMPLLSVSSEGGTSVPFPLPAPLKLMAIDEWWNESVWMQNSVLRRRDIILNTANKEGGAHVQAVATEIIQELRQGLSQVSSVKINGVEVGSPENYHFILIRQFAHELLNSPSLADLVVNAD